MPEREKISAPQVAFILIPLVMATSILSVPNVTATFARQDSWMSMLLSAITAVWAIAVMTALERRHPGQTYLAIGDAVCGRWIGRGLALSYAYLFWVLTNVIVDEIMSFLTLFAQPRTPREVTILLFLSLCGTAVWAGLEVIARTAEFLLPISLAFVFIVTFLLIPEMKPDYLRPVLAPPYLPIVQGAMVPMAWMGEIFAVGFLLPFVRQPERVRGYCWLSVAILIGTMTLITMESFMVNGPLTPKLAYAYYNAIRQVSIADFIERIDPVIVSIWIYAGFVKTSTFLWLFATSAAHVFGLPNHRPLVLPLTLLTAAGTLWTFYASPELNAFLLYTFPLVALTSFNVVPSLVFLIDLLRSRSFS
ncbi:endospore germination permease [Alicyclobacillus sp.]|uniref:GerAB/ArcD/ProY family transporter n=1 Tax=Alicyclobacillus sp. TaxID=61169 RepID=UPI0025B8890E|nr:endospore germination permease [Alicyclobacillus sp.]MCL6518063.1 spore germination protein [Alicyclobacillus sp.]